ncbi:MAG: hypothetical protein IPL40_12320 [Proteobacteria bacterium]|nr:hypothetical protein [Pseudomonadota bacterium]
MRCRTLAFFAGLSSLVLVNAVIALPVGASAHGVGRAGAERPRATAWSPEAFDKVQRGLPTVLRANGSPLVHVFATGITLPRADLKLLGSSAFGLEQRHLGLAIAALKRRPQDRVLWVGSSPLPAGMIEIYGSSLMGEQWSAAQPRFEQFYVSDPKPTRWLPEKILADATLLKGLKQAINGDPAQLHVYRMTPAEAELAVALGAPAVAMSPEHQALGTKSGSRELAKLVIAAHPDYHQQLLPGREHLRSTRDLAAAIVELLRAHAVSVVMVKANEGSSGEGQVALALPETLLQALEPLSNPEAEALVARWLAQGLPGSQLRFRHPRMSWQRLLGMV